MRIHFFIFSCANLFFRCWHMRKSMLAHSYNRLTIYNRLMTITINGCLYAVAGKPLCVTGWRWRIGQRNIPCLRPDITAQSSVLLFVFVMSSYCGDVKSSYCGECECECPWYGNSPDCNTPPRNQSRRKIVTSETDPMRIWRSPLRTLISRATMWAIVTVTM